MGPTLLFRVGTSPSFYELRAAAQRLEQARRSVELAARSHDIIQDRYREGLTILPELLDGETALTRARLREVAARRDVLVARATLDLATGNL
ncbi:MAG: TolC family protein [bacterium]|nr:TolC family protein [bacterium]